MGTPHVFVAWTDLKKLACDAWLVPGGRAPGHIWRDALPLGWRIPATKALLDDDCRTVILHDEPGHPLAVLTNITGTNREGPAWFVDGAREFLRTALARLRASKRAPLHGRARYLLALPLLGTQGGGAALYSGEITQLLLPALREEAAQLESDSEVNLDVVLVLIEGPAWAAAQRHRDSERDAFAALPKPLQDAADSLAERAKFGGLTLFLGAGIAKPAGLPGWHALLRQLARERVKDAELADFDDMNELDRAALIEQRLGGAETLGEATARVIIEHSARVAIGHALLASLPVGEVVTTNYDDLFERASAIVGRPCARIPGSPVLPGQRFVLKMHGCVSRPNTIVLSRRDYLRFQENRSALAGIVQSLLLTRHMLFVGFSFTDDNFHRIAHAVRSAVRGDDDKRATSPFGTNLVVGKGGLIADLWRDDLEWLSLSEHAEGGAAQARLAEIFLDRLSNKAATVTAHLGDDRWEGALSPAEKQLKERLAALASDVSEAEKATPAWDEVVRLLSRLGMHR